MPRFRGNAIGTGIGIGSAVPPLYARLRSREFRLRRVEKKLRIRRQYLLRSPTQRWERPNRAKKSPLTGVPNARRIATAGDAVHAVAAIADGDSRSRNTLR